MSIMIVATNKDIKQWIDSFKTYNSDIKIEILILYKITITPHSASITNPDSVTKQIMDNYNIIQQGGLPHNIVDTKKGY